MARSSPAVWLVLLAFAACADDRRAAARAAFDSFQSHLLRGEVAALRPLVTRESRQVVDALPARPLADKRPCEVVELRELNGRYRVHVTDPNDGDRRGVFVVVREAGAWRVDLVASAAHHAVERPVEGGVQLEPHRFSAEEKARIDAFAQEHIR